MDRTKPFAGVINNWSMYGDRIRGNIERDLRDDRPVDHPLCSKFEDGEVIVTSTVVALDAPFVQTRNSIYKLGTPSQ